MKKKNFDKTIKVYSNNNSTTMAIDHMSILYTSIPYRIPASSNPKSIDETDKYYKENCSKEDNKTIMENDDQLFNIKQQFLNKYIENEIAPNEKIKNETDNLMKNFISKIIDTHNIEPPHLRNLIKKDISSKLTGYLVIDYIWKYDNDYTLFINFLNTNFEKFEEYFIFFTTYFGDMLEYIDNTDLENLEIDELIDVNIIKSLAQKYYNTLSSELKNIQSVFKDFIDYLYFSNTSKHLTLEQKFFIFYTEHKKILNRYSANYKQTNSFNFEYSNYKFLNNANFSSTEDFENKILELDPKGNLILSTNKLTTTSIFSYFYISIYYLVLQNNKFVKKCKNCGKYFITSKLNVFYCENIFKNKQTCRSIGINLSQKKKESEQPIYGKYRKIYAQKAMKIKRYPDIPEYKINYEKWKLEAKKFMKDIKNEIRTYEEFDKWLDENH